MCRSDIPCELSHYMPKPQKPHTVVHIPGSHTLYVGPNSCARRHILHAARYGDRKHSSFLFITETDMALGGYEEQVIYAVEELLETLTPAPHIFILAVFCMNTLLGTDDDALLQQLREAFPGRGFAMEHIDPVTLNPKTNQMKVRFNHYQFLAPQKERDDSVTVLGSFSSYDPDCEIHEFLRHYGIHQIRELFCCKTYKEYQAMANSRLALGIRFVREAEQKQFTDVLGIPYYYFPVSYEADFVLQGYQELAKMLRKTVPQDADARNFTAGEAQDFVPLRDETVRAAKDTAVALRGLPVAVDSSAFMAPFSAAEALLDYGFSVKWIFLSKRIVDHDRKAYETIRERDPEIQIVQTEQPEYLQREFSDAEPCLAVGADSRRILNAPYFVDLWHDEGCFGFQGIRRLMTMIREAVQKEV